ncbi:MAG: hypothetical protein H6Q17_1848 [Bacteroidetes bacterium]|nr:hypothetical protein [Bacteroidota bacterium]
MRTLLKLFVGCILTVTVSSCFVTGTVTDEYGEAYVNYYPYYFCPDLNFYYNPDLNIYWWHQEGMWLSGSQLPYSYHIGYNTNYVIVSVYDQNPTRYYSQHINDYRRGYYNRSMYHYGDRPMQSLRSYRTDRTPSGYRKSGQNDDIYVPRRNPSYNNNGNRNNTGSGSQNKGNRSSVNGQNGSRNNSVQENSSSSTPNRTQRNNGDKLNQNGQATRPSQWNSNSIENRRTQSGSDSQTPTRQPSAETPQKQTQTQPSNNIQRQTQSRNINQSRSPESRVQSTSRPATRGEAAKKTEETTNK